MNDQKPEHANRAADAQSSLNVGLGLIVRLREWGIWSKEQSEDDLASLLDSAANEIERLREELESIAEMTDADNPESSRCDSSEDCLDIVFASATDALMPN